MCETEKDIGNVEAWAEVVEDMLYLAPPTKRAAILELALQKERAEREKDQGQEGGLRLTRFEDNAEWLKGPSIRHYNAIKRLTNLVVQVFVRSITNSNSPKDASGLLFSHHRYGTGSGDLDDYLRQLTPS